MQSVTLLQECVRVREFVHGVVARVSIEHAAMSCFHALLAHFPAHGGCIARALPDRFSRAGIDAGVT